MVGAAAPLQQAGVLALSLPDSYYEKLGVEYQKRWDLLLQLLGQRVSMLPSHGAYYIMTDIRDFGFWDDLSFVRHMIEKIGVAAVPRVQFLFQFLRGCNINSLFFLQEV
jgi:L-glutamine---4-(methylsulfanyl)-2-oxobutanoate aminotransferase